MPEIVVPREDRPSLSKYLVYVLVPVFLANAFAAMMLQSVDHEVIVLGGAVLVAAFDLAVVLVVVQSIVEEWFSAARIEEV